MAVQLSVAAAGGRPHQGSTMDPVSNARMVAGTTDEDLLRDCAERRSGAIEEIVQRFQAPVYRLLLRMTGSPEDAEEGALDVFTRVWQHAPRFQYRSKVATWIYRIAVNIARDAHQRRKSRPQEPWPEGDLAERFSVGSAESDAIRSLSLREQRRSIDQALETLSETDRLVIVLYYIQELEYPEIQKITGLSYTVLKTRLARARQRLKHALEASEREERP